MGSVVKAVRQETSAAKAVLAALRPCQARGLTKAAIQKFRGCGMVACDWSGESMAVEVALALLERNGLWLLQLRDDIYGHSRKVRAALGLAV